jgi:putative Holliday junction resolvase
MSGSTAVVLGFDFGMKVIGVATGNTVTRTATPLTHLRAQDGAPDWQALAALLQEWQPAQLVVGLPLNMDGSESEMSQRARRFARRLHGRFGLPVVCQDERLSSYEARSRGAPREGGGAVDSLAASVILEQWLNAPGAGSD